MQLLPIGISIVSSFLCLGCATTQPAPPVVEDDAMAHMSRQEVINAIQECEDNGTRAVVIYARDKWRKKSVVVPIDVQCAPIAQRFRISMPQRRGGYD